MSSIPSPLRQLVIKCANSKCEYYISGTVHRPFTSYTLKTQDKTTGIQTDAAGSLIESQII